MKNPLKKTLVFASLGACALISGCASLPAIRSTGNRNQPKVVAPPANSTTAPGSQGNLPIIDSLAVSRATNVVSSTPPTQTGTKLHQALAAEAAVVQLAPLTTATFDADIPTVGSFATLQTPYQDARAQEKNAPNASNTPQENVVAEPFAPANAVTSVGANQPNSLGNLMGSYVIETGDSLDIKFRNTPDLDNLVTVRPDGMISLQTVGDVPAAGLTPELMRQTLVSAYSSELNNPDIAVIVRSFSGNSIYVGGEVFAPGRVPLTGRVTTLNAIILAGGFKDTADKQRVVVRHGDGTCCEYDLKSVLECEGRGQDIQLRPYDVVYVPKSKIAKVNLFVEQYIDKVIPFSRNFGVFISHNTGLTSAIGSP